MNAPSDKDYVKEVLLEQGSKEWLEWRDSGIGSSDIAVIMGSNTYMTPLQLWELKNNYREATPINKHMQHGITYEPIARKWIEENTNCTLRPACFEDAENPIFKASVDGWNEDEEIIFEIKCPTTAAKIDEIKDTGKLPADWFHQIQWQWSILRPKRAFCAIWDFRTKDCHILEIIGELKMQAVMRRKAKDFWKSIQFGQAPDPQKGDCVEVTDEAILPLLTKWHEHNDLKKFHEKEAEVYKKQIEEFGDDGTFSAFGYKMVRMPPRRSYNVPQMALDGIDIDKYLKPSNGIGYYKITPPKE